MDIEKGTKISKIISSSFTKINREENKMEIENNNDQQILFQYNFLKKKIKLLKGKRYKH